MVRQMVRRGIVMALGLTALVCAVFSSAPAQVGAVDYFTAVGCNYGDYTCLYQRNGINPNAPQLESPRVYYQSLGYVSTPYGYVYPGYGYGSGVGYPYYGPANFGYGYGYGSYPYFGGFYGYGFNPFVFSSGSLSQGDISRITGFCNIGYGQQCAYPR